MRSYRELLADLRIGAGDRNEPGHRGGMGDATGIGPGRPREPRPGFGNYLRVVTANPRLTNFCQNLIDERSENSTRPAVLLGRDGPGPAVLGRGGTRLVADGALGTGPHGLGRLRRSAAQSRDPRGKSHHALPDG